MHALRTATVLVLLAAPVMARDPIRPAELPPADYAGQQYVDSMGCAFVRAGTETEVLWVPRVSREGVVDCSNPPSGKRVPVAEGVGVQPVPEKRSAVTAPVESTTASAASASSGGYFVAVGSFGVSANADRAEARLTKLHFGVVRGRVQGASATLITVFAGPFADAGAAASARDMLRADGFPDAVVIGP